MAKPKGIITLQGKAGDVVYVKGKYGKHTRAAPKKAVKKKLTERQGRTGQINKLSGKIHTAVKHYAGIFRPGEFYRNLNKRFQSEKESNRILFLDRLKGMDVNERYLFSRFDPGIHVKISADKKKFKVNIELHRHAMTDRSFSYYYLEFVLMIWRGNDDEVIHEGMKLKVADPYGALPLKKELVYSKPAAADDYMLLCRLVCGPPYDLADTFPAMAMKVLEVGSVGKESLRLLKEKEKRMTEETMKVPARRRSDGGEEFLDWD